MYLCKKEYRLHDYIVKSINRALLKKLHIYSSNMKYHGMKMHHI